MDGSGRRVVSLAHVGWVWMVGWVRWAGGSGGLAGRVAGPWGRQAGVGGLFRKAWFQVESQQAAPCQNVASERHIWEWDAIVAPITLYYTPSPPLQIQNNKNDRF
jgi:hypothetical protein